MANKSTTKKAPAKKAPAKKAPVKKPEVKAETPEVKVEAEAKVEVKTTKPRKTVKTIAYLNMRADAGKGNKIVKVLPADAAISWDGTTKDADGTKWYKVTDSTGTSGYVDSTYLK